MVGLDGYSGEFESMQEKRLTSEDRREVLSRDGTERREAMLGELLHEVDRVRSARHTRRRAALAVCAIAVVLVTVRIGVHSTLRPVHNGEVIVESDSGDSMQRLPIEEDFGNGPTLRVAVRIERSRRPERVAIVGTDPLIVERYAFDEPVRLTEWLDDRALLETLAHIGRPSGLININGRVRLSRPVSDAELAMATSVESGP
jgi:hypothetical protein